VEPVEVDGELLEVHPVAGERHMRGLRGGVLAKVSLPGLLVQLEHDVRSAQGVQDRPVGAALDGVVGPVVAAPALHAPQVAALIVIAAGELPAGGGVGVEQGAFEQGPGRRRQGGLDGHHDGVGPE
jgi:hypothetical protein